MIAKRVTKVTHKADRAQQRAEVFRLHDSGYTQPRVSDETSVPQPAVNRWMKERREAVGDPEHIHAIPAVYQRETGGIPENLSALALTRGPPTPTKKPSFVVALDLLDQINAYAAAHHLEIKTVLDLALRRCFAGEGTGDV